MKIDELTPRCPSVNMTVKILSLEEPREVGEGKTVRESLIGDETGTVVMSFWGEECNEVNQDDVLSIEKGRVSLVGGSLRVSLGRDGSMNIVEDGPENIRKDLICYLFTWEKFCCYAPRDSWLSCFSRLLFLCLL